MKKKILLCIGGVIILLIISMIILSVMTLKYNNTPRGNNEEVISSSIQNPQKALVIFQPSRTNLSADVAHQIAQGLNKSGYEVVLNTPNDTLSNDISKYSIVVFGTPVCASKPSTVVTDYMSKITNYPKRVAIFSTGLMSNTPEFEVLEKCIKGEVYKSKKFISKDTDVTNKEAYEFGIELAK